jgi:hypothetical protein
MDRTIRGLIAGIIAGVFQNAWNLIDYYLFHITDIRFLDWVSVLLIWSRPKTGFFSVFCLLMQLFWDGFLGIIFAHILVSITSKSLIIKSTLYSLMLWFIFKGIVNLFRVPYLSGVQSIPGAMSNVFAIILWGIVLGLVLKKLDKIL